MLSKTHPTRLYGRRLTTTLLPLLLIFAWWLHDSLAYVQSTNSSGTPLFWSASQATIDLNVGCPPSSSLTEWGPCWDDAAEAALAKWNAVGAKFKFRKRTSTQVRPSCSRSDRTNTAVWANTVCGEAFGNNTLAVTQNWTRSTGELVDSDVLFDINKDWNTYAGPYRFDVLGQPIHDFYRVALHEFGHVLGLGHPDEHGQFVNAIMNSKSDNTDRLQTDDINGIRAIYGSTSTGSTRTSALGIPGQGTTQSGIGVISGWKCRAHGALTIRFDGDSPVPLVYGSQRPDTRSVCGDTNNGFVAIWNWASLTAGRHTAVVYDSGVEFARSTFTVVTTGIEFLQGVTGSGTATLSNGQRARLVWSEASQGFVATEFTAPGGRTTPPASGVGQFLGTWRFTNSRTTQTYRFPRVEACRGDATEQCVYDDTQGAGLVPGEVVGYSYALVHQDGSVCRAYFLYDPNGNTVRGHYSFGFGTCGNEAVIDAIAEDVALKRYPTTGRRISQSASQAFSLETEDDLTTEDVPPEVREDIEMAIEDLLDVMGDIGTGRP